MVYSGSVPERLNGAVSKTAIPQKGIGGSNPPASVFFQKSIYVK